VWLDFLTSAWTIAVVPTALAIAGLIAFWKTVLEKRNLELENRKLQSELAVADGFVVRPTDEQIEKYAFTVKFTRRAIRIGSIFLAVALPATLVLQNIDESQDVLRPGRPIPPFIEGPRPIPQPTPPGVPTPRPPRNPPQQIAPPPPPRPTRLFASAGRSSSPPRPSTWIRNTRPSRSQNVCRAS
jgi:hypothetical protein